VLRRAGTEEKNYAVLRERDDGVGEPGLFDGQRAETLARERSDDGGRGAEGGPCGGRPPCGDEGSSAHEAS
jgi:hypothetical protein